MNSKNSLDDSFEGSTDSLEMTKNRNLTKNQIKNLMIKTHYTKEQIIAFENAFRKDFPNGALNKKQFFQIYKNCDTETTCPNNFCEHIFRAFDQNGDNLIDFDEFLIGLSMPQPPTNKRDLKIKLEWLFKIFDINGDGLIEKDEVQVVIDSFYKLLDEEKGSTIALKVQSHVHANEIFEKLNFDKKLFINIEQFTDSCIEDYQLLNLFAPSYPRKL